MTKYREFEKQARYQIRIKGSFDPQWSGWFDGFTITPQDEETLLSGTVIDQAAFYSHITKLEELGLILLTVERIEAEGRNVEQKHVYPFNQIIL